MAHQKQALREPEEVAYEEWERKLMEDPEFRAIYEEEAAKGKLWLQLTEARRESGLTQQQMAERMGVSQAQVARIEKNGYEAHTIKTVRRFVAALGPGYSVEVAIHTPKENAPQKHTTKRQTSRVRS